MCIMFRVAIARATVASAATVCASGTFDTRSRAAATFGVSSVTVSSASLAAGGSFSVAGADSFGGGAGVANRERGVGRAQRPRRDRVHLRAARDEPGQHVASDAAGGSCDQHSHNRVSPIASRRDYDRAAADAKSGQPRSLGEIVRLPTCGQSMANSGSSQRSPRSEAGA